MKKVFTMLAMASLSLSALAGSWSTEKVYYLDPSYSAWYHDAGAVTLVWDGENNVRGIDLPDGKVKFQLTNPGDSEGRIKVMRMNPDDLNGNPWNQEEYNAPENDDQDMIVTSGNFGSDSWYMWSTYTPYSPENLYICGNLESGDWNPETAPALTKNGTVFTIENITIKDSGEGFGYFSFLTAVGSWDAANGSYRFGAAEKDLEAMLDTPLEISSFVAGTGDANAWKIPAGTYNMTADFENWTLTIEEANVAGGVWYGITDIPGFTAEYNITYNDDKTLTVEALIETEKETVEADRNFHIYIGGDEWLKLHYNEAGVLAGTTTSKFDKGSSITWEWYFPYAGGVYQQVNNYEIGSSNEKPLSLRIKASAKVLSFESAEISYTVTAPEDLAYTVYYKATDVEAVAAAASPIVLTGLAESSEHSYEVWAVAGELESSHANVTFKTPAKDAKDLVYSDVFETTFNNAWLIGGDSAQRSNIMASLPWKVTYTLEGTGIYEIDLSSVENIVGLNPQIWSGNFKQLTKNPDTGWYEYNFGEQTLDAEVAISHYLAYDGGVVDTRSPYTFWGMVPSIKSFTATGKGLSIDSAEISYTVEAPTTLEYTVYYKAADGEAVAATANPIVISGLEAETEYTYEVWAASEYDETEHVNVSFKTLSADAKDHVYSGWLDAEFKNAFLVGETEANRRSIFATMLWKVTYTAAGTGLYEIDLSQVENVVGFVPQIYWNGFQPLAKNEATGMYEYNFGEQTLDAEVAISHYIAYAGDKVDVRTPYTNWGMEGVADVIGTAVDLTMTASPAQCRVGESIKLSVVGKDAKGHYVNAKAVDITSDHPETDYINMSTFVVEIYDEKGVHTFTAKMGQATATASVVVYSELKNSSDVLAGKDNTEEHKYFHFDETKLLGGLDKPSHLTDDNAGSYFAWNCKPDGVDAPEHYLVVDFGSNHYVETVYIMFETARAKDYVLTLSKEAPEKYIPAENGISAFAASDDVVFNVTGNEQNENYHFNSKGVYDTYRYLTLETSAANNNDWGIKIAKLKVYGAEGSQEIETGVDAVDSSDADAPVEFFNLNGVRVANPAAGLYIRRQGSKVEKVIVK